MSTARFDIVVVGAGMVGACAALALAQNGYRIALVEAVEALPEQAAETAEYELRVSAISPGSREILSRFGVWSQLDATRVCSYEKMHIWHENGTASLSFDAVDLARDDLGAIVENRILQTALQQACRQSQLVEWFVPDRVSEILQQQETGLELRLDSGQLLQAGLLLAADGRQSPTRQLAGLDTYGGDYRQTAFVANVETELPHQHTAWQRFLKTGPLAFLPLANGQSSIVWSCDTELAQALEQDDDKAFCAALGEAFEYRLGAIRNCGPRMSFPLGWHRCERWLKQRVLLLGDAAHGVHPLAGQGVNLGFSDVDLLAQMLRPGENPIAQKQLRRFERQRKSETWVASQSFSGLKWFYGLEQQPVVGLRDLGMRVIEKTPWFKRAMMQKAIQNLT